jgi:hypothetical protein
LFNQFQCNDYQKFVIQIRPGKIPSCFNVIYQEKLFFIKVSGKSIDGKPVSGGLTPEELDVIDFGEDVIIPDDKKKAAFPIPWGFLVSD